MDYTKDIWVWLKQNTKLPDEAIAGIMGNFEAESNCMPCRLEGTSATSGTSQQYADAVDSGTKTLMQYKADAKGWGLAQWTYCTRKEGLYNYCKAKNKSIADLECQLAYMLTESEYKAIESQLLFCHDIREAADLFCQKFENPALCNYTARRNYAQGYYQTFHGLQINTKTETKTSDNKPSAEDIAAVEQIFALSQNLLTKWGIK